MDATISRIRQGYVISEGAVEADADHHQQKQNSASRHIQVSDSPGLSFILFLLYKGYKASSIYKQ